MSSASSEFQIRGHGEDAGTTFSMPLLVSLNCADVLLTMSTSQHIAWVCMGDMGGRHKTHDRRRGTLGPLVLMYNDG